jgi:hypothetical protein
MLQADDLDARMQELEGQKKRLVEQATPVPGVGVSVTTRVCEGASVAVDDLCMRFHHELRGPVRFEKRKINNVTEFVSVNQVSGSVTVLPARKVDLSEPPGDDPDSS